jgi:hypothetical protein
MELCAAMRELSGDVGAAQPMPTWAMLIKGFGVVVGES